MENAATFGFVTWWGFTPAMKLTSDSDHVNILLVGSGDLRHVLMTLAHATTQHPSKPVHFYIVESCLEVYARHLLFMSLLCEPPERLGLQERTELFLELFGNTLVRAQTADYLTKKVPQLIRMVTDLDYLKEHVPIMDISNLKFKERDMLEGVFKFWRHSDEKVFNIKQNWESRVRHHLGSRYDARGGVFDWDYHMKLQEMVPVVSVQEYKEWRETGVAFHLRDDAPYESTNKTLASGVSVLQRGEHILRRGYWGDIVNSPYLSFGIESENKELFKTASGRHVKTSTNISEYNILSLVYLLTTGERYKLPPELGSGSGDIQEVQDDPEKEVSPAESGHNVQDLKGPLFDGSCQITFLPLSSASEIGKKAKFGKIFDIVYFSNSMVHHLTGDIGSIFAPECTLVLETARFMLDLNKEHRDEYVEKVTGMAELLNFKRIQSTDDNLNHLAFIRHR